MKSARVSLIAVVPAFFTLFPGVPCQAQAPTIQTYATDCYKALGLAPKDATVNPFTSNAAQTGLDCTKGTRINIGGAANAQGMCLSPSWAPTHTTVPGGTVPFQCFNGSFVNTFSYTNNTVEVTGAVLCKNERPDDNANAPAGMFDYVSMILFNAKSGTTCWFAAPKNDSGVQVPPNSLRDGTNVPDPSDLLRAGNFWQPPQNSAATNCWRCHDNGVWMNSPWFFVSNNFTALENAPRGAPYSFAATPNSGFQNWPAPVFVSPAADPGARTLCVRCHHIGAKQTANGQFSNTLAEWLGYVTGGSTSPVPNQAPVTQDPPGQIAGAAMNQAAASWTVTHWMPIPNAPQAPAAYAARYGPQLMKLQSCMVSVGQFADRARNAGRNAIQALKLINVNQTAFSITGECHVHKDTFLTDPPAAGQASDTLQSQPQMHSAGPRQNNSGPSRQGAHPGFHPEIVTDSGLTLTAQVVQPDGTMLSVGNMTPGEPPVNVELNSSLTLSWDPGPNAGCSVFASFPPGVIVPTPVSSDGASSAGSGYNWLPGEGPEGMGPLTEPGMYTFDFDCGFQAAAGVTAETFITLNLVPSPTSPVSPNPPFLMTLDTATQSNFAEAADWISYANPQNSYTSPMVPAGQTPQTDVPVGPSDNVLLSWVAEDNVPGSCTFSEVNGGSGGLSPIISDAGQTSVTLGSAAFRLFQLTCTDLNGGRDTIEAKISGVPSIKLNVTTSPSSGVTDTSYVNITGSGFPAGTVTPANVTVELSASCGGSPVGITAATSVIPIIGTSDRVQFFIPGLDAGVYYVTISDLAAGDANFSSRNCSMLTVGVE